MRSAMRSRRDDQFPVRLARFLQERQIPQDGALGRTVSAIASYLDELKTGHGLAIPWTKSNARTPRVSTDPLAVHYFPPDPDDPLAVDIEVAARLLYDSLVRLSTQPEVQKTLNQLLPLAPEQVMLLGQLAWNIVKEPEFQRLPLGTERREDGRRLAIASRDVDFAELSWTKRTEHRELERLRLGKGDGGFRRPVTQLTLWIAWDIAHARGLPPAAEVIDEGDADEVAQTAIAQTAAGAQVAPVANAVVTAPRPKRVLIVEDHIGRELEQELIDRYRGPIEIYLVADRDQFERMQQNVADIDLVLLDYHLGGSDSNFSGLLIARQIMNVEAPVAVLGMSFARPGVNDGAPVLKYDLREFVSKHARDDSTAVEGIVTTALGILASTDEDTRDHYRTRSALMHHRARTKLRMLGADETRFAQMEESAERLRAAVDSPDLQLMRRLSHRFYEDWCG
ncbi:hypothetical protein [Leifsonia sp. EB34]|uniref:hypothetical protein n=1 Tax=Leifsonia sp. EB34 TaxID=3156303 RepID=UPI0035189D46